jgi:hypothetical protein
MTAGNSQIPLRKTRQLIHEAPWEPRRRPHEGKEHAALHHGLAREARRLCDHLRLGSDCRRRRRLVRPRDDAGEYGTVHEHRDEETAGEHELPATARAPARSARKRRVVGRPTGKLDRTPQSLRIDGRLNRPPRIESRPLDEARALSPGELGIDEDKLRADVLGGNGGGLLLGDLFVQRRPTLEPWLVSV